MKKCIGLSLLGLCLASSVTIANTKNVMNVDQVVQHLVMQMSLDEKIGQKLMLDFRYWCPQQQRSDVCTESLTQLNSEIKTMLATHHIGGVILFANNLVTIPQITTLTYDFQQAMVQSQNLPLFIGTDQESGIVARLPRNVSPVFPGNIALAAAYLNHPLINYSAEVGTTIARDLKAVGINVDFAPDVDVNVNSANPVIHVRSFSDDPQLVSQLGLNISKAISAEQVGATLKHFPGHGDTNVDSHLGLAVVNHSQAQAWQIDLLPFKNIIAAHSPDMIMTAHIQFPALDDSLIFADKQQKNIITPATLSRKIQYHLLREKLHYQGIVVTDALDMGGISQNFAPTTATIKAFQAGNDIALMPVRMNFPQDAKNLEALITAITTAVNHGTISLPEMNESVERILKLKIKLGLLNPDTHTLPEKISLAKKQLADPAQYALESAVTLDAITLVQNNKNIIPLKLTPHMRIHILMPWLEQGAALAFKIHHWQNQHQLPADIQVTFSSMSNTDFASEKLAINRADVVIIGESTRKSLPVSYLAAPNAHVFSPYLYEPLVLPEILSGDKRYITTENFLIHQLDELNEAQFAYQTLQYATLKNKTTIFVSLLAPYDLPNYRVVADAMLAIYDPYGYLADGDSGFYRGPSFPALARILFGMNSAAGKLPIDIPNPLNPEEMVYRRGFGMTS